MRKPYVLIERDALEELVARYVHDECAPPLRRILYDFRGRLLVVEIDEGKLAELLEGAERE